MRKHVLLALFFVLNSYVLCNVGLSDEKRVRFVAGVEMKELADDGIAKARKGDFNGAIEQFSKAIELHPKEANFYGLRGNS